MGKEPPITAEAAVLQTLAAQYHRNAIRTARLMRAARLTGTASLLCIGAFAVAFLFYPEDSRRWTLPGPTFWLIFGVVFLSAHSLLMRQAIRLQNAERRIARMVADWFR